MKKIKVSLVTTLSIVAVLFLLSVYGFVRYSNFYAENDLVALSSSPQNIFSSISLGVSFNYPSQYHIIDRLESEEKAVLLNNKEFLRSEIAPWYHAPIMISRYDKKQIEDEVLSFSNIKRNASLMVGQSVEIIEGDFSDYPNSKEGLKNHVKIIIFPEKNLVIEFQNSLVSEDLELKASFETLLKTLQFK